MLHYHSEWRILSQLKLQSDSPLSLAEHYKIPGQARNDGAWIIIPNTMSFLRKQESQGLFEYMFMGIRILEKIRA